MTDILEPKIHVLYENDDWLVPLAQAFEAQGLPYSGIKVVEGGVDLNAAPPEGVFFNRLSASAHTRGHENSVALGGAMLRWFEHHGRRVVNGRNVIDLEVRKFDQYALLEAAGIRVPRTIACVGDAAILDAARGFDGAFIVKPNCGGKGLGVRLFQSVQELEEALKSDVRDFESVDSIVLVQDYIEGKEKRILRNEFIGGEYYYSVEVNTEEGFELCPADACCIIDAKPKGEKFRILDGYRHPMADQYAAFLKDNGIEVAAFESIEAADGTLYTYDINTNTNYNSGAEAACAGEFDAYGAVATYLGELLKKAV